MDIFFVLLCGALFFIGGQSWGNKKFRRLGIPILLALALAIKLKCWWVFLAVGAGYGLTILIGYGEPTPDDLKPSWLGLILRKGWIVRGVYGLIVASAGALGLVLGHFLALPSYFAYLALNFTMGAIFCYLRAPAFIIEPIVGLGIGSILLFI